jgi:hypothetical protein
MSADFRYWALSGPHKMSDLSLLWGEERKSHFGAGKTAFDPFWS